jgi:hypothetical protein
MEQAIVLTGLGTEMFSDAIDSIIAIEDIFSRQVGSEKIVQWKNGTYLEWDTIYAANRYFSSGSDHHRLQPVPFHPLVDPEGTLAALARGNKVHCSDNVVEYYEQSFNNK